MNTYEMVDMLTCPFEALMMIILLNVYCIKRVGTGIWSYVFGVLGLTILFTLSNRIFNFGFMNAVGMSLCVFIVSFLYKGNISAKVILSVFGVLMMALAEILTMFIISAVLNVTTEIAINEPSLRLLGIIISKMLTFTAVIFIRTMAKERELKMKPSYWILFFIIFASAHLAVFLIFTLSYSNQSTYLHTASAICSFGLLFSAGTALYLYERLSKQAETEKQKKLFEQQLAAQTRHLEELLVTQEQFKKFRHDLSNHLIVVGSMFENSKNADGLKYIKTMKSDINVARQLIDTGNTALDAIINTKKAIAENKDIAFELKLQMPQKIPADAADICIIFGNALDNAIEACERITKGERKISLTVIYENSSLFVKLINTAPKKENERLLTSKKDAGNHGYGIKNIKTALEKYNCEPSFKYEDNEFELKFVMFFS